MDFFMKLGAYVEKQAADWRVFHEAEKQYLNSPAGFVKSCGNGLVHWAFASLLAIYYGISFLYDGRATEVSGKELISSCLLFMACFLLLRLFLDYFFKRLTKKRFFGYLLGVAIGVVILIWNLPDVLQFSTKATLLYLSDLFTLWGLCEFFVFSLGPMTSDERLEK